MDIAEAKKSMRRDMRAVIARMSSDDMRRESEAACARVCALEAFRRAGLILMYRAMPNECDPAAAAAEALRLGKRVAYPLCHTGGRLTLHVPCGDGAFAPGRFGIMEPVEERCETVRPEDIELIITPGLAFGRDLTRLGRGGGFYDRLLGMTGAVRAGFTFDEQIVDTVPAESFDMRMDMLVSACGLIVK